MRLMIDTTAPLSETDYKVLSLLLARHEAVAPAEKPVETPKAAPKKAEPTEAPEPAAKPEETTPEVEETTEEDQDEPVSDELLDKAVSKAKALMQDGKKAAVKQALEAAGVPRVGAIETTGQATRFLTALGA